MFVELQDHEIHPMLFAYSYLSLHLSPLHHHVFPSLRLNLALQSLLTAWQVTRSEPTQFAPYIFKALCESHARVLGFK